MPYADPLVRKEYEVKYYIEKKKDSKWVEKKREKTRDYHYKNKEKRNAYGRKYYYENREKFRKWYQGRADEWNLSRRELTLQLRKEVLEKLGNKCLKCGYSEDWRALQVDHINGGGGEERRKINTINLYKKVLKEGSLYYQLLCANCNWIKKYEQNEVK